MRDAESATRVVREWIGTFLVGPNPDLGRDGDVCPFMRGAVQHGQVVLRPWYAGDGRLALVDLVRRLRHTVLGSAAGSVHATAIVVPHGVEDDRLTELVTEVQRDLKSEFVARGLMIGEFFPGNPTPGLHNEDFRPLASPVPLLAIRRMVLTDLAFLTGEHVPALEQRVLLGHYRRVFGDRLGDSWTRRLVAAEKRCERTK